MKSFVNLKKFSFYALLAAGLFVTSCNDDEVPEPENTPEVITDVKLIFTNADDDTDVIEVRASDPDGEGVAELEILDELTLDTSTTYRLTYEIFNNLETPGEDIGEEIQEEDDEHQFFYAFSDGAFSDPMGDGNIDNAADAINYTDADGNGNPVGYTTTWTTSSDILTGGTFTARLQHQPDVKTDSSTATDGDTDFDLTFVLNIQ